MVENGLPILLATTSCLGEPPARISRIETPSGGNFDTLATVDPLVAQPEPNINQVYIIWRVHSSDYPT